MTRTELAFLTSLASFASLALAGCDRADGSLQDQLEALTIDATDAAGQPIAFEDEARNTAGLLGVSGTSLDPQLHLTRETGDIDVALHMPGSSDLTWLDGATVTVSLPPDDVHDRWTARPFIIADAEGPALVAQLVGHAPDAADEVFGSGFVRYGTEQGYDERGSREFHTRSVIVQTDEGPLEVLPGEVHGIQVGGDAWRFVLIAAYEVAKHTLCCLEEMPFDTGGHLWFFGVIQTYHALLIALVMQLAIILINESNYGVWPAIGGLPIAMLWKRYYDVAQLRHATRNLHGLSRGRMPLRDCAVVDARRDSAVVKDALKHLADADRFFEAPEVLPPSDHPSYTDAIPGPPISDATDVAARLEAIDDWLGRHDDAAAAFLERVNGTATVLGEDAIAVSDDVACGTIGCGGL